MLIIFAAGAILYAAIDRLLHPGPVLGQIGVGLAVSAVASMLNYLLYPVVDPRIKEGVYNDR